MADRLWRHNITMIADEKIEQIKEPVLSSRRVTISDNRYLIFYTFGDWTDVNPDKVVPALEKTKFSDQRE